MSKKIIRGFRTNMALYSLCLLAFVIVTIPVEPLLAAGEALAAVVVLLLGNRRNKMAQASVRQYMDRVSGGMDSARSSNMLYAPLPMLVFDVNTGEVLWSNDMFLQLTSQKEKIFEMLVDTVVPDFSYRWLLEGKREYPELFPWNGRIYRVFGSLSHPEEIERDQTPLATTYWMDVTDSEEMRQTLELTRPLVAILMVDNYEELMKACPESKRSAVLAALAEAGIKTAVVSNKPDATTKTLAARFFPGLPAFGQRDDVPPKPAPDLVFRALDTLGVAAADAVYVGDSEVDVATARNAGLPLAAVSWGFRGRQALAEAGAAVIVDTAAELLEVLR